MATIFIGSGDFTVGATIGAEPAGYSALIEHAHLHDEFDIKDGQGTLLIVAVESASAEWPELLVSQRFKPGPEAGFRPGILLVPETDLLLLGAGERLLAYDLRAIRRLWVDVADMGFWGWKRHRDVIVMSAELELAAWDLAGKKLWSTFVEPPWQYRVKRGEIHLDVMGKKARFSLNTGPSVGSAE